MDALSPGQLHERLDALIRDGTTAASDADTDAVQLALAQLAGTRLVDEPTIAFLRRAHSQVLGYGVALATVVDTHRAGSHTAVPRCRECRAPWPCPTLRRIANALAIHQVREPAPVGRADAWRLADRHFARDTGSTSTLISIDQFPNGRAYVARPVRIVLPAPPRVPDPQRTVLVIDRYSAHLSRWPLLPIPVLQRQYRCYLNGKPMILDPPPDL